MKNLKKCICLLLAMLLMLTLVACGKKASHNTDDKNTIDIEPYIGTWKGADHDGENVVHYLIFDENGYWNVYMNYAPLLRAIKQLPNQLVSFKVFCNLQKSEHTGCYYEYVEDVNFAENFTVDENGILTGKEISGPFTKVSTHSGEPSSTVVGEARDLFDRALVEAHSK